MSRSSADKSATVNAAPDLQRVRSLFASPGRLAASAFLRREIARRMNERLDLIKFSPHALLDAGCGNGADLAMLQRRYPAARLFGIDASPAMLAATRTRLQAMQPALKRLFTRLLPSSGNVPRLMCGDFADLPLHGNSLGLLWSNLALHWHSQPQTAFAEWRRVLQTDGLLMFSCFGPDTFRELRQAFAAADDLPHTLPFVDMHDLGDMLLGAGFSTPVMDMEMVTVTYDAPDKLLADIRAFGGNPLAARRRSLLGRHAHERFRQALEAQRDSNGKIPLTFEILYGHAFKPEPVVTTEGEAIVRFVPRTQR